MDRLICGDVGFEKTEVAIRATFMVAKSNCDVSPQVAIVVPTTILGKQHYLRFRKIFKDLGLNIVQLSSLITNSEAKIVKEQIKNGTAPLDGEGKITHVEGVYHVFQRYAINYKYRDSYPICEEWAEKWTERCRLK